MVRRVRDPQYWGLPYGTPIVGRPRKIDDEDLVRGDRYVPGQWKMLTRKALVKRIAEQRIESMMALVWMDYHVTDDDIAKAWETTEREVHEDAFELVNGTAVIRFDTDKRPSEDEVQMLLTLVEQLREYERERHHEEYGYYPDGPDTLEITFVPKDHMPLAAGPGTLAAAHHGIGKFWMVASDELFGATYEGTFGLGGHTNHTTPAARHVHPMAYAVAHEYGHITAYLGKDQLRRVDPELRKQVSEYADSDADGLETYAEVFADMFLTRMQGSNDTIRQLATDFGIRRVSDAITSR